jgi:hypothetical protein
LVDGLTQRLPGWRRLSAGDIGAQTDDFGGRADL